MHVVIVGVLSVGACCTSMHMLHLCAGFVPVGGKVDTVFLCIHFVPLAAGGNSVHMLQRSVHML